jgi:hypothetical protein
MLVELLRPAGPDLARRWLAALLMVDEQDRPALVGEVERRVVEAYERSRGLAPSSRRAMPLTPHAPPSPSAAPEVHIVHPPVQRAGFVEQVVATYGAGERAAADGRDAAAHDASPPTKRGPSKPARRGRAS